MPVFLWKNIKNTLQLPYFLRIIYYIQRINSIDFINKNKATKRKERSLMNLNTVLIQMMLALVEKEPRMSIDLLREIVVSQLTERYLQIFKQVAGNTPEEQVAFKELETEIQGAVYQDFEAIFEQVYDKENQVFSIEKLKTAYTQARTIEEQLAKEQRENFQKFANDLMNESDN